MIFIKQDHYWNGDKNLFIVIAATRSKLTPTLPYLKNGMSTHRNLISVQLGLIKRSESKGNTTKQNTKSATHKLQQFKKISVKVSTKMNLKN